MDTFIIYLDDATYAKHILQPMLSQSTPTRWVLVACAPQLSHHISKWLNHSTRESWRKKWCDQLFSNVRPILLSHPDQAQQDAMPALAYVMAKGPLPVLTQQLLLRFGSGRVIDARRPKFGQELAQVTLDQTHEKAAWQVSGAVGSLSAVLMLAAD